MFGFRKPTITIGFDVDTRNIFQELIALLKRWLDGGDKSDRIFIQSFRVFPMRVVKADHPDVNFTLDATFQDSEGNPVTPSMGDVTYDVSSSDPAVVAINADDDGDTVNGSIHIGQPGQADLHCNVMYKGTQIGAFGEQITVVAGDIASMQSGGFNFENLEEVPTEGGGTDDGGVDDDQEPPIEPAAATRSRR